MGRGMARWLWLLARIRRQLWFRSSLYGLLSIFTALMAIVLDPLIPPGWAKGLGAEAVGSILSIVASSMLAVTTFSLGIMVSATATAASGATPRAASLLAEDAVAQSALSTFLGAFLFSLVGLVGLNAGVYGAGGQLVLFISTLFMLGLVVITVLRWINQLTALGRVGEVVDRVEAVAIRAMTDYAADPAMGCNALSVAAAEADLPGAIPVFCPVIGYIQHLDIAALSAIAEASGANIRVAARPGAFCVPDRPLALISGAEGDEDIGERVARCFSVSDTRSFDQDPRFGLVVLAEIASKALSPGINDAGTAIDVVGTLVRVLLPAAGARPAAVTRPRLSMATIAPEDMFDDAFSPIARDGAAMVEVAIKLQKVLGALAATADRDFAEAARRAGAESLERAMAALPFKGDRRRLRLDRSFTET